MSHSRKGVVPILSLLFFFSGAAGLIYEVVWMRSLTTFLGASSLAVNLILMIFMGGLGAGAWYGGRLADRLSLAGQGKLYVAIEVGIGLYALFVPLFMGVAESAYVAFHQQTSAGFFATQAARSIIAFVLLFLPTALMGATLPVMSRFLGHMEERLPVAVSILYAFNTFGAIAGTLAAGYWLLPDYGVRSASITAAVINLLVGGGFWAFCRRVDIDLSATVLPAEPPRKAPPWSAMQRRILLAYGLSGAVSMFYQVAWTRSLTLVLGATTYAFTTMLATFLAGIAIGSFLFRRLPVDAGRLFIGLQLVVAASALVGLLSMERLPFLFLSMGLERLEDWTALQYVRFFISALVMLPPTIALGMMFPTVCALVERKSQGAVGGDVGGVFAINTVGAALGAGLAGWLAVPGLGLQKTLLTAVFCNVGLAYLVALTLGYRLAPQKRNLALGAMAALWLFLPAWLPQIMSSGVYVYAEQYYRSSEIYNQRARADATTPEAEPFAIWKSAMQSFDILYYDTGLTATVAVMDSKQGVRSLLVNGKVDASAGGKNDMRTQVMLGQLAMLFHPDPQRIFVVGLGSGITVGSILPHAPQEVVVAEISPGVIEAAQWFNPYNYGVLSDQRVHIHRQDARHYLLTSPASFDLVISQPSNPWIRGESSLFTLEWFRLVHAHLTDDGLLAQWIPAYHISPRGLKTIIHTMRQVFPQVTLWGTGAPGDVVLLAAKAPSFVVDDARVAERLADPPRRQIIADLGLNPDQIIKELALMDSSQVENYLQKNLKHPLALNTDDDLTLEFMTPKSMVSHRVVSTFVDD